MKTIKNKYFTLLLGAICVSLSSISYANWILISDKKINNLKLFQTVVPKHSWRNPGCIKQAAEKYRKNLTPTHKHGLVIYSVADSTFFNGFMPNNGTDYYLRYYTKTNKIYACRQPYGEKKCGPNTSVNLAAWTFSLDKSLPPCNES